MEAGATPGLYTLFTQTQTQTQTNPMILFSVLYAVLMFVCYQTPVFQNGLATLMMFLGILLMAGAFAYSSGRLLGSLFGLCSEKGGYPAFLAGLIFLIGAFGPQALEEGEFELVAMMIVGMGWTGLVWCIPVVLASYAWHYYRNRDKVGEVES